jgi:hypothetical protein
MKDTMPALKSEPVLSRSQLAFRIGLARTRTASYPLHKLDFIMMDLERPDYSHRHADWCVGDLTGRVLEFLSCADGIDGINDSRLKELFERILRTRRPSGLFGRYAQLYTACKEEPEKHIMSGCHRLFNGLIKYYERTNDFRALEGAIGLGDWFLRNKDEWKKLYGHWEGCGIHFWITEPLANLYRLTGEKKYLDFSAMIVESVNQIDFNHSHGLMTTMRGLQLAAMYTGDKAWNEKPERVRRTIIDNFYEMPDGCIAETFPRSFRNEGCSIADWLMLNLNSGFMSGNDEAYTKAETILWNALFFNQFVTGGFGHRDLFPHGYLMGPVSECWWCCTENGGLGMAEFARHAVTLRDKTVWVNLLVPGTFSLRQREGSTITVTIGTNYPSNALTLIRVTNLPEGYTVKVRIPTCIKQAKLEEIKTAAVLEIRLTGRIGHTLEPYQDKVLLKYGPVILAPMVYYWNTQLWGNEKTNAPPGYIPTVMPEGLPRVEVPSSNPNGFMTFSSDPWPDWSYFETGPDAELSVEGASCHVNLIFDNGQKHTLWFSPMCHLTSDMSYYETPIMFKK